MYSTLEYYFVNHPRILHFEWDQSTTFSASPTFLILTVLTYLSLTLLLSHSPSIPTLHPTVLRFISTFHNLTLLFLSVAMAVGCSVSTLSQYSSLDRLFCFPSSQSPSGPTFFWAYIFYLSKLVEFIDTLLIILSGSSARRLTFLHVYHHAVVVIMCYVWLYSCMSLLPVALVTNSLVHVLMYSYYLLCALGRRPKWKRAVTNCQIVQFVFSFLVSAVMLYLHFNGEGCSGIRGWCFNAAFNASLLYLFVDFHANNYIPTKKRS